MAGKKKRHSLRWIIGLVAVLVGVGLTYAWSANRVIKLGYEISAVQAQIKKAQDLNRKLRVELTSLSRPERIEALATKELGLGRPSADRVVVVR